MTEETTNTMTEANNTKEETPTMITHTMDTVIADPEGVYQDLLAGQCELRESLRILLEEQLSANKITFDSTLLVHPPLEIVIKRNNAELAFRYIEKKRSSAKDRYYMPQFETSEKKLASTFELVTKFFGKKLMLDRLAIILMRDYQEFWGKACISNKSETDTERPKTIETFRKAVLDHGAKAEDEDLTMLKKLKAGKMTKAEKQAAKMKFMAMLDLDEGEGEGGEGEKDISLEELNATGL